MEIIDDLKEVGEYILILSPMLSDILGENDLEYDENYIGGWFYDSMSHLIGKEYAITGYYHSPIGTAYRILDEHDSEWIIDPRYTYSEPSKEDLAPVIFELDMSDLF